MNKSYRIKVDIDQPSTQNIKLKLEQEVDQFEILSLKIDQKDVYQSFNCEHGVVVGRVIANEAVGIPNAKVSVFIPITDADKLRPEIRALYPYENPRDTNTDGKRYNLLPRVGRVQPDGAVRPQQPFGSFPTKEEVVTNETVLEVYEKYYKYSTVTNESGDYMLFGVPVGTQTVHLSVDILDIGRFSMTPATLVTNLGFSPNLFNESLTEVKESTDLDDLPNIETQEISVDVIPFCGDDEIFDIGITRQDFRIRAQLTSTFIVFGNTFTDNAEVNFWGGDRGDGGVGQLYRQTGEPYLTSNKILGTPEETIYELNNSVSDTNADNLNFDENDDLRILSRSEYSRFVRDGDFVYIVQCNRRKIITDETGQEVVVPNDFTGGAFTEWRGFITMEYSSEELPTEFRKGGFRDTQLRTIRTRIKIPQQGDFDGEGHTAGDINMTRRWARQNSRFEFGKFYSVARFHSTVFNTNDGNPPDRYGGNSNSPGIGFMSADDVNDPTRDIGDNVFSLRPDDGENFPVSQTNGGNPYFGSRWLNFSIFLGVYTYVNEGNNFTGGIRTNTASHKDFRSLAPVREPENSQIDGSVGAFNFDTKYFVRSDLQWTEFMEVPVNDINVFASINTKGFDSSSTNLSGLENIGNYYRLSDGRPVRGTPTNSAGAGLTTLPNNDSRYYFFKGFSTSDCIRFLFELGLV
jgi:hypothetical protein